MNPADRTTDQARASDREARAGEGEDERLSALILEFDEALSGGSYWRLKDANLSPEAAEKFREMQSALRLLEQARLEGVLSDDEPEYPPPPREVDRPRVNVAGQVIGHFELEKEIGRGGYGVVFLAHDREIGRQVALKIPRPEVLTSPSIRRRFLREAKAAGALDHPNLVPVFEVGEDGPFCFLATAYCRGTNLAKWIQAHPGGVPPELAARITRDLASGVAHAHARGVLHRDIKPSNVLLEPPPDGETASDDEWVPRLTDFGLAKLLELTDDETCSGMLIGTPAYMAPEQAEGRLGEVGPATDVYALGLVLYEMLASRPPFRGESDIRTLQLVAACEVPPLRVARREVPRELEAIVLRCLQREPERRYASARDLTDDLNRFLQGEPTVARPATTIQQLTRRVRRRPALAGLVSVVCVAATLIGTGRWWYTRELEAARALAAAREFEQAQFRHASDMSLAHRALQTNQVRQARQLLQRWIPQNGQTDHRGFLWNHFYRILNEQKETLVGHTADVYCVRYSPLGGKIVTASADGTVRLWRQGNGECLRVFEGHTGEVNYAEFSYDAKLIASASDDGTARVWNAENGTTVIVLPERPAKLFGAVFSPDGRLLAVGGEDAKTEIWDTGTWTRVTTLERHSDSVGALAFSHDGRYLATVSDDCLVRVWNVDTWELYRTLRHDSAVTCLDFDPRDERLITGERYSRRTSIWDLRSGELHQWVSHHHEIVHGVAFASPGDRVGVVTKEGVVELHDLATGNLVRNFQGHAERVWSLSFSPSGKRLATASADRTVKIWRVDVANPYPTATRMSGSRCLSITPDGDWMAVGQDDGSLSVIDVKARQVVWQTSREFQIVGDFDGDGFVDEGYFVDGTWQIHLAAGNSMEPDFVRMFGLPGQQPVVGDWDGDGTDDLGVYQDGMFYLLHADGVRTQQLAAANENAHRVVPIVGRWSGTSRDQVGVASHHQGAWTTRLHRNGGETLVTIPGVHWKTTPLAGRWHAGEPSTLGFLSEGGWWLQELKPPATKTRVARLKFNAQHQPEPLTTVSPVAIEAARDLAQLSNAAREVEAVAISPDGKLVAASQWEDARVRIWDVTTGRRVAVLRTNSGYVKKLLFAANGRRLLVGHSDGWVSEFGTDGWQLAQRFRAHAERLDELAQSRDGRLLATSGEFGGVKVWDVNRRLICEMQDPIRAGVLGLSFSHDGTLLAAGGQSRAVTIWKLADASTVATLAGHESSITAVDFAPDGKTLATASEDGTLRLWDLPTHQELCELMRGESKVFDIAFTRDGRALAAVRLEPCASAVQIWSAAEPPGADQPPPDLRP